MIKKYNSDSVFFFFKMLRLLEIYEIKIKLRFLKSSEHVNEKGDGSCRGFGDLSLFSDSKDMATWSQRELSFNRVVDTKTNKIQMGPTIVKVG